MHIICASTRSPKVSGEGRDGVIAKLGDAKKKKTLSSFRLLLSKRKRPPPEKSDDVTNDVYSPLLPRAFFGALTLTPLFFCSRLFIYTRSGRIARDVQAGGDGQRQGLPTIVANGGGTD